MKTHPVETAEIRWATVPERFVEVQCRPVDVDERIEPGEPTCELRDSGDGAGNAPGPRVSAAGWVDAAGDLWLFGGSFGLSGPFSAMNDLWKYSAGQWTWMAGSNRTDQSGIYGTQGTAAASNTPGARAEAITWTDATGNLGCLAGMAGTRARGLIC
jgi:hypothetical protein